jgi:hypothetical protein
MNSEYSWQDQSQYQSLINTLTRYLQVKFSDLYAHVTSWGLRMGGRGEKWPKQCMHT